MSYRNDHDAALARIEALEAELEQARQVPAPTPPQPRVGLAIAIAGIAAIGGALGMATLPRLRHKDAPPAAAAMPAVAAAPAPATLRACREAITHVTGYDAASTSPRARAPLAVDAIESTGARCRPELAAAIGSDTFRAWLRAEDELAGDISRIVVYYENDPFRLDGYATAAQLWREYDRDVAARDAVLPRVDRALGIAHPQS